MWTQSQYHIVLESTKEILYSSPIKNTAIDDHTTTTTCSIKKPIKDKSELNDAINEMKQVYGY